MGAVFCVAAGSAIGGVARYALTFATVRLGDGVFPWGTLAINVLGSFVIGLFFALTVPDGPLQAGPNLRAFVMTGLCGGFTTFSAFSLQSVQLLRTGHAIQAVIYMAGSVLLCAGAVAAGFFIADRFPPPVR